MTKQFDFNYPIILTPQEEGGYLVIFPDIPEAITQGEDIFDVLEQAADCLEEAIANRIEMKLKIPIPSICKKRQYSVSLNVIMSAKVALYLATKDEFTKVALAKKLNWDEKEVRRLLDPHYNSKFTKIEYALNSLGIRARLDISYYQVAEGNNKNA